MSRWVRVRSRIQSILGRLRSFLTYKLGYYLRYRQLKHFFEPQIRDWHLIFDIGAHLGLQTKFFHHYSAAIIAVEPHPYYFKKLHQQFISTDLVTVINAGLSDTPGSELFYPSSSHPSVSTFNASMIDHLQSVEGWKSVQWSDPVEIPVTTLSNLISLYGMPDYVKIDVEGYEDRVLKTLTVPLKFLSFEFLPMHPRPAQKCLAILGSLGTYHYLFAPRERFVDHKWLDQDEMEIFVTQYRGRSGDIFARLFHS